MESHRIAVILRLVQAQHNDAGAQEQGCCDLANLASSTEIKC
jgi:hypothetical protein